jgi:anti-sigma B factor antagonist
LSRVDRTDRSVVLRGHGEIDAQSAGLLRSAARAAVDGGARHIELELAGVSFLDSSGLRTLSEVRDAASERGATLRIVSLSLPVRRILEISGVLDELTAG